MKKYSILVASALASLAAFTSCDDTNDCGCACNVPVIESVEKLDQAGVNIAGNVEAGTYVALLGQNLGDVTSIQFGDRNVAIRPAYRTDNSIILQIPSVTKSCVGTLLTSSCPTGYAMNQLTIVIGTPTVYMMYNEFVADGDTLMLRGSNFVGDQMQVDFTLTNGQVYTAHGDDIILPSNDGSQMYVKVPAGAAPQQYLKVRNGAENKESVCNIMFRDTRNVFADWDNDLESLYLTGAVSKQPDGSYEMVSDVIDWLGEVPPLYSSKPGANKFGVFRDASAWEGVMFAPEANGTAYEDVRSVFGPFKEAIKANPASASSYVVKFEVRVPSEHPTKMMLLTLGFTSASAKEAAVMRPYCAGVQTSKLTWDKSSAEEGWKLSGISEFSTYKGKWMTIQVPMDEFIWSFRNGKYITSAQNFTEGNFDIESDQQFFGDPTHVSYVQKYQNKLADDEDLYEFFGGFAFSFNNIDAPENSESKNSHFAIDNIRIVPNDGNGAYYPKLGWGVPRQHYFEAPRKSAFAN